ncbi:MAG: Gfo/Idh/MocA family oxidoreductase, partial [Candidatus Heimdallarchaeota archaeon]|nr:Gfo/Idh/MocA family oxidoreductase [Candidatus Heimdallarchaeota archaeon]
KKHIEEYNRIGITPVIFDLDQSRIKEIQQHYKVNIASKFEDILKDESIVGINVCTPNKTHYNVAKQALLHNKNVLLEKPMTLNHKNALELIKIAQDKNKTLVVGHIYRFNNAIKYAKELIENNKLGQVYLVSMRWSNLEPVFEDRDVLFDLAPHPFDILDYLFNEKIDNLYAIGKSYRNNNGEEVVFINGNINNILIHLEVNWLTPPKTREITITGDLATIVINSSQQIVQVFSNNHSYFPEIIPNNTIQDELLNFMKCIKGEEDTIVDGTVGARIIETIEMVKESLIKGEKISRKKRLVIDSN